MRYKISKGDYSHKNEPTMKNTRLRRNVQQTNSTHFHKYFYPTFSSWRRRGTGPDLPLYGLALKNSVTRLRARSHVSQ